MSNVKTLVDRCRAAAERLSLKLLPSAFIATRDRKAPHTGNSLSPEGAVPSVAESGLLFRFGFLLHDRASPPDGDLWRRLSPNWRTLEFGDLSLRFHPETVVRVERTASDVTVLIGESWLATPPYDRDPTRFLAEKSAEHLSRALDDVSGRFALIARRNGRTAIYHDAFGARSVCYRRDLPTALASHPELLAAAYRTGRDPALADLMGSEAWAEVSMKYLPGDFTVFDGVFFLIPNNLYDFELHSTRRYWPRRLLAATRIEDLFEECDRYFEGLALALKRRHAWLSITGGIDSRVLLAAMDHFGADFETVTWTRFNFDAWEAGPVAEISEALGRRHFTVDESNDSINEAAIMGDRNGGNYRGPSSAVAGMSRLMAGDPNAIFVRGLGGEVIRGFYNTKKNVLKDYSAAEMTRRYASTLGKAGASSFLPLAFEGFHRRANAADAAGFGIDPNDLFYWEHRVGTWATESLNSLDPAGYSIFGFNSRRLAEVGFGLPNETRLTKKLFLEVVRRYSPKLADVYYQ